MCILHHLKYVAINFRGRTNVKHSFCDFVMISVKVSSLPLLKITTKSTHFLPAKKKIPILTPRYQIPTPSGKKFANCKYFFEKCE